MIKPPGNNGIYWGVCKDVSPDEVQPAEESLIQSSRSRTYKASFRRGRIAAKEALLAAGAEGTHPVLRGPTGAPVWPADFTGSISHSDDLAIAAIGRKKDYFSIGIDCEPLGRPVKGDLASRILVESELKALQNLSGDSEELCLKFFFSAKESIYKSLSPVLHVSLPGFKDVELKWVDPWIKLSARILVGEKVLEHGIECFTEHEHLITAIFFSASDKGLFY